MVFDFFLIASSLLVGYFAHFKMQRRTDLRALQQARQELGEIRKDAEFDFFPGTFQYRPIVSGYTTHAIDTVFVWHNENDFGIGGSYNRDQSNTIDEFPLVFNFKEIDPDSFVKLGEHIAKFGESLIKRREREWRESE